jgi:N-acetylneuraminate lyase
MPSMAGADFPMAEFLRAAAAQIPNFAGIKYTHDTLMDYAETLTAAGRSLSVLAGRDEILLSFLAVGATGAVGSTYNYAAPLYHRLIAAHSAGDSAAAQKWQKIGRRIVVTLARSGGMGANKAIMRLVTGIDCGPVRAPLRTLTAGEVAKVKQSLKAEGLFAALKEAAGE